MDDLLEKAVADAERTLVSSMLSNAESAGWFAWLNYDLERGRLARCPACAQLARSHRSRHNADPTRRAVFDPQQVPKNDLAPEVRTARGEPGVAAFLVWSRFPFYEIASEPQGTRVSVSDLRMANAGSLRALVRSRFVQSVVIPHHAD